MSLQLKDKAIPFFPLDDTICEYNDMIYFVIRKDYLNQAREKLQL